MSAVQLPAIHLNGNSKQSLLDGLEQVRSYVQCAIQALDEVGGDITNMRNFYILPDGGPKRLRAIQELDEHRTLLNDVVYYLENLWRGIDAGGAGAAAPAPAASPKDRAPEKGVTLMMGQRTVATVLHGLRLVQEMRNGPEDCSGGFCDHFHEIKPLSDHEIDEACAELTGEAK